MRLLLDECVDWRLLRDLTDHDAKTLKQVGWEHVKNGALLRLAVSQFDAFLTVDNNLPHQQNTADLDLIIIVFRGRTTRLSDLRELVPALRRLLEHARPGEVHILSWRDLP